MIYVDELFTAARVKPAAQKFGKRWCHLSTDGELEELHQFASRLGLPRAWFQPHATLPHYDLTPFKRAQAVDLGAREITTIERLHIAGVIEGAHEDVALPVPLTLFAAAQSVNTERPQSTKKQSRGMPLVAKSNKAVSLDSKSLLSQIVTVVTYRAYPQEGRFPSVITDEDAEVRRENIDPYEYTLFYSVHLGAYIVRCSDSHNTWLEFGPFTEAEGNAFIDERVARAETLRR